jgi:chromosome segregation ATPase
MPTKEELEIKVKHLENRLKNEKAQKIEIKEYINIYKERADSLEKEKVLQQERLKLLNKKISFRDKDLKTQKTETENAKNQYKELQGLLKIEKDKTKKIEHEKENYKTQTIETKDRLERAKEFKKNTHKEIEKLKKVKAWLKTRNNLLESYFTKKVERKNRESRSRKGRYLSNFGTKTIYC